MTISRPRWAIPAAAVAILAAVVSTVVVVGRMPDMVGPNVGVATSTPHLAALPFDNPSLDPADAFYADACTTKSLFSSLGSKA